MAMQNGPFISDFPIKPSNHRGFIVIFQPTMFDDQRGYPIISSICRSAPVDIESPSLNSPLLRRLRRAPGAGPKWGLRVSMVSKELWLICEPSSLCWWNWSTYFLGSNWSIFLGSPKFSGWSSSSHHFPMAISNNLGIARPKAGSSQLLRMERNSYFEPPATMIGLTSVAAWPCILWGPDGQINQCWNWNGEEIVLLKCCRLNSSA